MDADIVVTFNPKEKKDIYVTYPNVQTIHQTDFNIHELSDDQDETMFYKKNWIKSSCFKKLLYKAPDYTGNVHDHFTTRFFI